MQAPLIPTGFIHGDQGILVPVYPPDALDQYMTGAQVEQASTSADTPPSLPAQPPNTWRPYPPPAFTPGIPMPPGIQHPSAGPFPMMGPQGWMPNQAPFSVNQYRQSQTNVSLGPNGAPMQTTFEQRGAPSWRQYRRDNPSRIKNGGRGQPQPGRYPRGSFAPKGAMNGPTHFTGSQQDAQCASEWNR